MKIRTGFVSNSSSSSFIVAVDPKTNPNGKVKITIDVDLSTMGEVIKTERELIDYYMDERGYNRDDIRDSKQFEKSLNAIKSGKHIIQGSFDSDSENSVEQMLCEMGLPRKINGVDIIDNEGGY